MRRINTDLHKQQFGLEPVLVVAIKLADWIYYGDRDHERFEGRVTEVANLDNVINITQNASSASVTVQLIDTDRGLKDLYNATDLHLRPLKIYQFFIGSDFDTDKILLFEGHVASPVTYNEAQMTLTFTGLSRLQNVEVGFSPDNAVWQHIIPNELEAQPWPMPFGSPSNYPATLITKEPIGALTHGFGIPDFTSPAATAAMGDFAHGLYIRNNALANSGNLFYVGAIGGDTLESLKATLKSRAAEYWDIMDQHRVRMIEAEYEQEIIYRTLVDESNLAGDAIKSSIVAVAGRDKQIEVILQTAGQLGSGGTVSIHDAIDALKEGRADAILTGTGTTAEKSEAVTSSDLSANGVISRKQKQMAQAVLQRAQQVWAAENRALQNTINRLQKEYAKSVARASKARGEVSRGQAEYARILAVREKEAWSFEQQQQYSPIGELIEIFGGKKFPPNEFMWLKIGACLVYGKFTHTEVELSGDSTFRVAKMAHPKACDFLGAYCTELESGETRVFPHVDYGKYVSVQDGVHEAWVDGISQGTLPADIISVNPGSDGWTYRDDYEESSYYTASTFQFDDWSRWYVGRLKGGRAGFAWIGAGSRVRVAFSNPVEFIISIVPCEVKAIKAYRTYGNARHLEDVPSTWYTLSERDYGDGLVATVCTLLRPLDSLANAGYERQIFATVESTIGPNVVDVLEYLVNKYLPDTVCDATSFARVRAEVEDWPVNFVINTRPTILNLLSEICYQACIALWFHDSTLYLRYLPNIPEDVLTISESDIDFESLELHYTETEDVITKIIAMYRPTYTLEDQYKLAARYNTAKYGTNEQVIDYFIYNDREAVVHSLTFWLIRQANTWKKVTFTTALTTLVFDTMDPVCIQLPDKFASNESVVGIIEQVMYDTESFTLQYTVWLPVRTGEMSQYPFAYLNVGDIDDEFPEPEAWVTGNGIGSPILRDFKNGQAPGGSGLLNYNWPNFKTTVRRYPRKARANPYSSESYETWSDTKEGGTPQFDLVDGGVGDDADGTEVYVPEDLSEEEEEEAEQVAEIDVASEPEDDVLSLQGTLIVDSVTGNATPLAAFFSQISDGGGLVLRDQVYVRSVKEDVIAPFTFKFDPTRDEFAAKLAYLADDEDDAAV